MICMAFADLLGATFWFADVMHSICPPWMILNLYGYQSAQMWSSLIGAYLVLKFSQKYLPPEFVFHIIAWGVPFIPQAIILSKHMYKEFAPPQGCWLEFGQAEMLVVAIPQVVTVFLNSAFLAIIFMNTRKSNPRWGFRNRDKSLFYIQVCCLVTTFASILQSIPHAPQIVYNVSYVLGASQGLFNTLSMRHRMIFRFFSWTNQMSTGLLHQQLYNATNNRFSAIVAVYESKYGTKPDPADVAPLLSKPFPASSYHAIKASEIN